MGINSIRVVMHVLEYWNKQTLISLLSIPTCLQLPFPLQVSNLVDSIRVMMHVLEYWNKVEFHLHWSLQTLDHLSQLLTNTNCKRPEKYKYFNYICTSSLICIPNSFNILESLIKLFK